MKIKFANGTEMEYLEALETEEYFNGSNRRTLTVTASTSASLDKLYAMLTEENLANITLTNEEANVSNVYDGYVLLLSCGMQSVLTAEETTDTPALYEQRLIVKLGKRTYIEQQLAALGVK